jgi:acyl dehydratase
MGLYFEDLEVGQQFESVGRTVTNHEVMEYAGLADDFNQLHTDDEFAKASPFGRRIAHGVLVLAIMTGLTQRLGLFDGTALALLGLTWNFHGPVFLNDTVHFRLTIDSKRPTSKPDRGIVVRKYEVLNQNGQTVQTGTITVMVRCRPTQ